MCRPRTAFLDARLASPRIAVKDHVSPGTTAKFAASTRGRESERLRRCYSGAQSSNAYPDERGATSIALPRWLIDCSIKSPRLIWASILPSTDARRGRSYPMAARAASSRSAIGCDGSRRAAGVAARRADPSPQCAMLDGGQQQGTL